jgi:hypothetical protein
MDENPERGIKSLTTQKNISDGKTSGNASGPHLHFDVPSATAPSEDKIEAKPTLDEMIESFMAPVDEKMTRFAKAVDDFAKEFVSTYRTAKKAADEAKDYKGKHSS